MAINGLGNRFKKIHPVKALKVFEFNNISAPMYIHALMNTGIHFDHSILIVPEIYRLKYQASLDNFDHNINLNVNFHSIDYETAGPLMTLNHVKGFALENFSDHELLVINCDQILTDSWEEELIKLAVDNCGIIPTIKRTSARHSYVELEREGSNNVIRVREKEVLSPFATIGLYWFKSVADFFEASDQCIRSNDRAPNGEFYVSHVYNYLAGQVAHIEIENFYSLGEDYNFESFLEGRNQID